MDFYFQAINHYRDIAHGRAVQSGWWAEKRPMWQPAGKIAQEATELLDAIYIQKRASIKDFYDLEEELNLKGDEESYKHAFEFHVKDTVEDELADIVIRALDLAGKYGIDLDWHMAAKFKYNSMRGFKHGKEV